MKVKNFIKKHKHSFIKITISIILLSLLIIISYLIFKKLGITSLTKEQIQDYIKSKGIYGPIIFILISFLQVTLIPIPGTITILAGSYLFGPFKSFLYSFIGMFLGSIFAFFLGRIVGKPFIYWISGNKEKVDNYLIKLKGKEKIVLFFMFLFPFFPDDLLCSLSGILPITLIEFLIIQLITRISSIGGIILLMSGEFIPLDGVGIPILIVISILGIFLFSKAYKNSDLIKDKIKKLKRKK